ncbi:signal peptidase I [Herbiconiux sp. L3-i23]|uniref:signal peptidase I n=1 Tax=Herbiconiux sp. L3-i23 TaxID=2905871 RepID=UPI002068FAB2|nr:signal peptidase I [Herbiconiux sp. L3-i23]BDI23895.1 hypothetical protein L3i23_26710 [Herbiconiux sp. L3-i23]
MTQSGLGGPSAQPRPPRPFSPLEGTIIRTLSLIRWALVIALSALLVVPAMLVHFGGRTIVEVTGGSMTPTLAVGDVVIIRPLDSSELRVGDVVTVKEDDGGYFTHRVTQINADGGMVLKGDANFSVDSEVRAPSQLVGVMDTVVRIPFGTILVQLQQWPLRISLLVTILGIAFLPLRSATRSDEGEIGSEPADEASTTSPFFPTSELSPR